MKAVAIGGGRPLRVEPTDRDVARAALRLLALCDRPAALPILGVPLVREVHNWLLAGRHGPAIRHLGCATAGRSGSRARSPCCAPAMPGRSGWRRWQAPRRT